MKARFGFIDPGAIMGVVVALMILGVGVYAFFVITSEMLTQEQALYGVAEPSATQSATDNSTYYAITGRHNNTTGVGNSVFNIIGIVLIIGAIMSIVGIVYNYVR